jgi:hypothetical protein
MVVLGDDVKSGGAGEVEVVEVGEVVKVTVEGRIGGVFVVVGVVGVGEAHEQLVSKVVAASDAI